MCPADGSPGYYCNPEGGVFACMDWTAGSNKLQEQEDKFSQRTSVWPRLSGLTNTAHIAGGRVSGDTGAFNNCAGDSWSMFPGQVRVGVSEVIVTLQDLSTEVSGELSTVAVSTETGVRAVPAVTTFPPCPRCRG